MRREQPRNLRIEVFGLSPLQERTFACGQGREIKVAERLSYPTRPKGFKACDAALSYSEALGDLEDLMFRFAADSRRAAGATGIISVPSHLQAGVGCSLEQQREVLSPVCGK